MNDLEDLYLVGDLDYLMICHSIKYTFTLQDINNLYYSEDPGDSHFDTQ